MKRHISYLKYIIRHKWYVFKACVKLGVPFRGITHDLSKFRPCEWFAYAKTFYAEDGTGRFMWSGDFDFAWLMHQKVNKHHWQYWLLLNDDGRFTSFEIPEPIVREMVADWSGAGEAIKGESNPTEWYYENRSKIILHEKTRKLVEKIIEENWN